MNTIFPIGFIANPNLLLSAISNAPAVRWFACSPRGVT